MRTIELWEKNVLPGVIEKLPARIANDLRTIPAPKIKTPVKSHYIYGQVGSGKTVHAVFMAVTEMKYRYLNWINSTPKDCGIHSVPELLFDFKRSYDRDVDETEGDLLDRLASLHLLVLDDFGVEKISDWAYQLLYLIVNRRYSHNKTTIFTSNFSLEQISAQLGDDRLTSRIQHMCELLKFEGDYRV